MRLRHTLIAALLTMTTALPSWSATHYVAPEGAKIAGKPDGSKGSPWPDPLTAINKAKGGDTILLMDGDYAMLAISNRAFSSPVTIRSMNGKKAHLERISINGNSRNMVFQNLSIWPSNPDKAGAGRVMSEPNVTDMVFDGLDVRSAEDAGSYATWSKEQWANRNLKGFQGRGARITLKNSSFTGVGFAIVLMGPDAKAINNKVQGFAGDGLRVLGDNSLIRGNRITDCVRIDANHPDGMQSWSVNGVPVKGLVIEQNTIIEWSNPISSPYRCRLQGIGFFDGFYDDLVIRNNLISSTAYHGISVYGARNAKIINNTVVEGKGNKNGYPWIGIFKHKNGKPSTDVVVANNVAMKFMGTSSTKNRVTSEANSVIIYPAKVFKDVLKFNYQPKTDSGFVDTGEPSVAPKVDVANNRRPAGKGPDRGAYETGSTPVAPADPTDLSSAPPPTAQTAGKWLSAP